MIEKYLKLRLMCLVGAKWEASPRVALEESVKYCSYSVLTDAVIVMVLNLS